MSYCYLVNIKHNLAVRYFPSVVNQDKAKQNVSLALNFAWLLDSEHQMNANMGVIWMIYRRSCLTLYKKASQHIPKITKYFFKVLSPLIYMRNPPLNRNTEAVFPSA